MAKKVQLGVDKPLAGRMCWIAPGLRVVGGMAYQGGELHVQGF